MKKIDTATLNLGRAYKPSEFCMTNFLKIDTAATIIVVKSLFLQYS